LKYDQVAEMTDAPDEKLEWIMGLVATTTIRVKPRPDHKKKNGG